MPRLSRFFGLGVLALLLAPTVFAQRADSEPRLLRAWTDPVKLADGTETVYRYEVTHDYDTGETLRFAYDPSGQLVETVELVTPTAPMQHEVDEALAILRADESLSALTARSGASIEGGFVLFGDQLAACAEPARCLQFDVMSPNKLESLQFVVVDLRTGTIVERNLFPDL